MEDMVSSALFHVIDAKTSYNMLLGRPWLHENAVVPSTWHQCFKYCRNGIVKKVLGDNKPFIETESHFADAKYYIEDANKGKEILPPEEQKSYNNQNARKNESSTLEPESLKSLTLPLTQINMKQPSKPPLKGFVPSTQEEEGGQEALAINEKGFDPKAFKLLIKAGYDPKEKLNHGKLSLEATCKKLHGLNATQIMLKEKGHAIQDSRVKAQTVIFTLVQSDDEDDKESVASSNYISNNAEENIAQTYHITLIEEGYETLSFMDGSSGYNQIRRALADEELTAFRTPKMNPSKCAFGVTSGKFLGFIVRQWGVEIEQAKIDAILRMLEPRNIHKLKSLQGKLAYLGSFISNLAGTLCRNPARSENDEGKENALYYLSRTMTPNELKYSPIEKLCLALIFSIQKLKHYFQSHNIHLVSKANPLKYVMVKPVLSDRLARWYLQLQQFEITYVPQNAVKGQVLADFLADHPMPAEWELSNDLPDEDVIVIEVTPP
ncbi:UNVERIFIED_CONTAM: Retrovirus-related Pol polyprotein from transposon opus [Sesamum angustifolium]|uniref:Retrovirus-related Pol polyprotein from transposon opus n=1 Tax=Sesamum angustifolium TaxID=2727405 RepID=A0AAW2IHU3_9LAMI